MLKFGPDQFKTKEMCKHAAKKLPFLIRYVPDQYKTQRMCDKAILEDGGILVCSDCYKNQEMCNKVVDNYPHALNLFLNVIRLKKCMIKLLILLLLQ